MEICDLGYGVLDADQIAFAIENDVDLRWLVENGRWDDAAKLCEGIQYRTTNGGRCTVGAWMPRRSAGMVTAKTIFVPRRTSLEMGL